MKSKGKKLVALVMAAALCLTLAACSAQTVAKDILSDMPEDVKEQLPEELTGALEDIPDVPLEGTRYTDFTGTLLGGGEYTLSDQEGKVILLNFWATWCDPCVGEMPAFPRLMEKYGDELALVAVDQEEDEQTVADFMAEAGYDFPVVLDTDGSISALYPSMGIPYTVIIAPDGTVASTSLGADSADEMFEEYCKDIDAALGR